MSVVGSETSMEARRVDADSSGARDGVARLSKRPLRGVELRLSEERVSIAYAPAGNGGFVAARCRGLAPNQAKVCSR